MESIVNIFLNGRMVVENIRRIIHFQLIVNLSIFALIILFALVFGEPVFSPLQLLWLNIIIECFAVFALSTDRMALPDNADSHLANSFDIMNTTLFRNVCILSVAVFLILSGCLVGGSLLFE